MLCSCAFGLSFELVSLCIDCVVRNGVHKWCMMWLLALVLLRSERASSGVAVVRILSAVAIAHGARAALSARTDYQRERTLWRVSLIVVYRALRTMMMPFS